MLKGYHKNPRFAGKRKDLLRYINLKLASMGQPIYEQKIVENGMSETEFIVLAESLLNNYQEKMRLLSEKIINPTDNRIQNFINNYLKDIEFNKSIKIPFDSFVLDKPGIAREISLPPNDNEFINEYISSYRVKQGVLHNPKHDRRTTKGSFHIVNGGIPIPTDKIAVPKLAFANLLHEALHPPQELLQLPFTYAQEKRAKIFTSLLLKPTVCPKIPGIEPRKTMEIRFFTPGSLVANLDFVESVFGNAGDPYLHKNDAALDVEHWTGHTGCIILAPHLTTLKKKDLGLPAYEDATERQKKDGMCWKDIDEIYNDGVPFKITARDISGVVVTLIADNYFGYTKKEVKTQITYSANLYGLCEEEHAGGTLVFPRENQGTYFSVANFLKELNTQYTFKDVKEIFADKIDIQDENYAIDKKFSNIIYLPENAFFYLYQHKIEWEYKNKTHSIKLLRNHNYILPSGHKIHMKKHPVAPKWNLILTDSNGSFLHKPATVSGGGKSEISKSLLNAIIYGTFFINDIDKDFELTDNILETNFKNIFSENKDKDFYILDNHIPLGDVIKLMIPYNSHTKEHNDFIKSVPDYIKALIFFIKHISLSEKFDKNWKDCFVIDKINGRQGHCLLFNDRKITASYLRVGFENEKSWFVHSLRPDFIPAAKIQVEDDISASVTVPPDMQKIARKSKSSIKLVTNCEYLFFQRPDEAINRGYDKQAESDLAQENNFITNYQPLTAKDGIEIIEDAISFDLYTDPIKKVIQQGVADETNKYFIASSHPRILANNKKSTNPRYLQKNPNITFPIRNYLAEIGIRLDGKIANNLEIGFPVNASLIGRRNNKAEQGIRPLAVYNPIHYQETPELFMDLICSLTGKSPSTTGAGSEGALTKGPFNMLSGIIDINNALLSHVFTETKGFSTVGGYIGSDYRFDHDISILIPELWSRMSNDDRNPKKLIEEGSLEKIEDFTYKDQEIKASRLGYRITRDFVFRYFGKIFEEPMRVLNEKMLKPETQNLKLFVDGIQNIIEGQEKAAKFYFEDNSIEYAIPPIKALLHIMTYGNYEGYNITDPEVRELFTKENILASTWYKDRLINFQQKSIKLWEKNYEYLNKFQDNKVNETLFDEIQVTERMKYCSQQLKIVKSDKYLKELTGSIGLDSMIV